MKTVPFCPAARLASCWLGALLLVSLSWSGAAEECASLLPSIFAQALSTSKDSTAAEACKDKSGTIFVSDGQRHVAAIFGATQPVRGASGRGLAAPATAEGNVIVNSVGMKLKLIQPGSFLMGSVEGDSDEQPTHMVKITKPFYLGVYEVTQSEWTKIMGTNLSSFEGKNLPVESVSWPEAQEFLKRLSEKEKKTYRLPTEAEWEYACRAGSKTKYCFGDDAKLLDDFAWFDKNNPGKPHPVGAKKPNEWGLYDMHGNVWEWCADWQDSYLAADVVDPKGPSSGLHRVRRGGGWYNSADNCRSANRNNLDPSGPANGVGFRAVLAPRPALTATRSALGFVINAPAYEKPPSRGLPRLGFQSQID